MLISQTSAVLVVMIPVRNFTFRHPFGSSRLLFLSKFSNFLDLTEHAFDERLRFHSRPRALCSMLKEAEVPLPTSSPQ